MPAGQQIAWPHSSRLLERYATGEWNESISCCFTLEYLPQVPLSQAFFVLFVHPCKYSSKKGQGAIELSSILLLK